MALSSRSGEAALQEGEARITAAVRLREKAAAASEQTFRLYRNGQLEETIPAASGQESGTWEGTGTVSCAAGDQLEVRFFCVDGLGLGYEFPVRTWTVKEDGLARHQHPGAGLAVNGTGRWRKRRRTAGDSGRPGRLIPGYMNCGAAQGSPSDP